MSPRKTAKKPISKATSSLLSQLQRIKEVRNLPERVLIVCEDSKSAPNYFYDLIKHLNISSSSVHVVPGDSYTQPIQVVESAIELKEAAAASESTEPFEHVWCVIDGDYGEKIPTARDRAEANGVCLAVSTMCFEYWILLHFEEDDKSTLKCEGVIKKLKKHHIKEYTKGKCDFKTIVKNMKVAYERARRLREPRRKLGHPPEEQNPCSEVYLLIDLILPQEDKEGAKKPERPTIQYRHNK